MPEIYRVQIEKMIGEGLSLARLGSGIKVMIPYGVKGDVVEFKVVEKKKDYWIGNIKKIITPSPFRTKPRCPHFGNCGGCQWQMIDYEYQPLLKRELIEDALRHIGGISEVSVLDTIPSPKPFNYRNKVHFPLKRVSPKQVIMGFYKRDTHYIIDVDECPLHISQFDQIFRKAKKYIGEKGLSIYDEKTHTGAIRNFTLRGSERAGESLIVVVSREKYLLKGTAKDLKELDGSIVGVVENINPLMGNTIFGEENRLLAGSNLFRERIKNFTYIVSATSFFQVNTDIAEKMVEVLENQLMELGELDTVVDAYSGVGLFSLPASKFARKVYALEISSDSSNCAVKNVTINNRTNVEVINGDAEEVIETFDRVDAVILDPPRKGIRDNMIRFLAERRPTFIFYFSCNPSTLARDLKKLIEAGYHIDFIQPFDMFPQTFHVETLTFLKRKSA